MKRLILIPLLLLLLAPASAQASLSDTEAFNSISAATRSASLDYESSLFGAFGVWHCPTGNPCWTDYGSGPTTSNYNRTGPNTVWWTFNWTYYEYGTCINRYWVDSWRARAYKPGSTVTVDNMTHISNTMIGSC